MKLPDHALSLFLQALVNDDLGSIKAITALKFPIGEPSVEMMIEVFGKLPGFNLYWCLSELIVQYASLEVIAYLESRGLKLEARDLLQLYRRDPASFCGLLDENPQWCLGEIDLIKVVELSPEEKTALVAEMFLQPGNRFFDFDKYIFGENPSYTEVDWQAVCNRILQSSKPLGDGFKLRGKPSPAITDSNYLLLEKTLKEKREKQYLRPFKRMCISNTP